MAQIVNEVIIVDKATNPLKNIHRMVETLKRSMNSWGRESKRDISEVDSEVEKLRASINSLNGTLGRVNFNNFDASRIDGVNRALREQLELLRRANNLGGGRGGGSRGGAGGGFLGGWFDPHNLNKGFNQMQRGITFVTGSLRMLKNVAMEAGQTIGGILSQADKQANMFQKLGLITNNPVGFQRQLYETAQKSRVPVGDIMDITNKMLLNAPTAFAKKGGGLDTQRALNVASTFYKMAHLSGAGTQQQRAAILQLQQGLASNTLQGDEYRSIAENLPMIENYLVEYLNKTKEFAKVKGINGQVNRGNLKKVLSKGGYLTSDVVLRSLDYAKAQVDKQFDNMPITFGVAMTKIKNQFEQTMIPISRMLSGLFNNKNFGDFSNGLGIAFDTLATKLKIALNILTGGNFSNILDFIAQKAQWMASVVGDAFMNLAKWARQVNWGEVAKEVWAFATTLGKCFGAVWKLISGLAKLISWLFNCKKGASVALIAFGAWGAYMAAGFITAIGGAIGVLGSLGGAISGVIGWASSASGAFAGIAGAAMSIIPAVGAAAAAIAGLIGGWKTAENYHQGVMKQQQNMIKANKDYRRATGGKNLNDTKKPQGFLGKAWDKYKKFSKKVISWEVPIIGDMWKKGDLNEQQKKYNRFVRKRQVNAYYDPKRAKNEIKWLGNKLAYGNVYSKVNSSEANRIQAKLKRGEYLTGHEVNLLGRLNSNKRQTNAYLLPISNKPIKVSAPKMPTANGVAGAGGGGGHSGRHKRPKGTKGNPTHVVVENRVQLDDEYKDLLFRSSQISWVNRYATVRGAGKDIPITVNISGNSFGQPIDADAFGNTVATKIRQAVSHLYGSKMGKFGYTGGI